MADSKLADLTADASPTSDDLIYVVNDPAGTPADRKVTLANLATALAAMAGLTGAFVGKTGAETVAGVKTFSSDPLIPDEAYGSGWNGVLEPPTKNAVYDEMENRVAKATFPCVLVIAIGDETTAITTGTAKTTFRMPHAMTLTAVRASLTTVSSSGTPTFDINEAGTTILSTKLTIDANEKTSTTAAAAAVISDAALADDAEITIDVDVAGTGAAGAKIYLIGTRSV